MKLVGLTLLACAGWLLSMRSAFGQVTPTPQQVEMVARIQREIGAIRGLAFQQPVRLAARSAEEFQQSLDARVTALLPANVAPYYGAIVSRLGLYRGPAIVEFAALMKTVLSTQVAAYYLPAVNSFFVQLEPQSEVVRGALYAHELHHGLQHQNFDLVKFLNPAGRRNQDELLARRAVVEGEAYYMMALWLGQHLTGSLPTRESLAPRIASLSNATGGSLGRLVAPLAARQPRGVQLQAAVTAMERIPRFMLQTMMASSLEGVAFVFAVQAGGWSEVDQLFTERPPVSTEQILHPEKWAAREGFVDFTWPEFAGQACMQGWTLLEDEVLGEFRWRIVFDEQGFGSEAAAAAAGWNGDRYAIFKRQDSDALLLLMRTSWDMEGDAAEFAALYRRLLAVKYPGAREAVRVRQRGKEVHIIEGGRATDHPALLRLLSRASVGRM